jgi:hypothetical protein
VYTDTHAFYGNYVPFIIFSHHYSYRLFCLFNLTSLFFFDHSKYSLIDTFLLQHTFISRSYTFSYYQCRSIPCCTANTFLPSSIQSKGKHTTILFKIFIAMVKYFYNFAGYMLLHIYVSTNRFLYDYV